MPLLRCRFPWGEELPPPDESEGKGNPDPGEGIEEIGVNKIMGTQSYLDLLYRHSPSEWDQLTRAESEPISTGPFPTWDDCQQLLQVQTFCA